MVLTAWTGAHDADLVCVLLDAKLGIDAEADTILTTLAKVAHPKILVINKIDLVPREKLLALAKAANDRMKFEDTFMISALSGDGIDDLQADAWRASFRQGRSIIPRTRCRWRRCAISPPKSPAKRSFSSCIRNCRISPPSRPTAGPTARTARSGSSRPSLSSGKASARSCWARAAPPSSRSARRRARRSPRSPARPVHLFLFVKVRENWGDDPDRYREMGIEFPKE